MMNPAVLSAAESCWCDRSVTVGGLPFDVVTMAEALFRIEEMISSGRSHQVVTANVHFIVQARRDAELHRIICEAPLVVCDGMPIVWASHLYGNPLPERVAGVDLTMALLERASDRGYRVFFLGGAPEVTKQGVANVCRSYPGLTIAGDYSPPMTSLEEMDHSEIQRRISAARPDLLFVCFGCPKSEKWIARYGPHIECPVAIGIGATIDVLARHVNRAPRWMQRYSLEWLFRIMQEPSRLSGRYLRDIAPIGYLMTVQWLLLQLIPAVKALLNRAPAIQAQPLHFETCPLYPASSSETLTYVNVSGCLTRAPLRAHARVTDQLFAYGQNRIVLLNLSRVTSIDSTGTAYLLEMHRQLRRAGFTLTLVAPSPPVKRALRVLKLDRILPQLSHEDDLGSSIHGARC